MRRSLALLPLALGALAAPAQADPVTLEGCFGVAVVVCDPTVTVTAPTTVGTYEYTVPVCAGSCYDVPVTMVSGGVAGTASLCVSYETRAGVPWQYCITRALPVIPDYPGIVTGFVEDFVDDRTVNEIVADTSEDAVDEVWESVLCRVPVFENNVQCW